MALETQGLTLFSHADDFRSHWVRFVLAEKEIKHQLILVDYDDEDLASLNPYNNLPMLLDQGSKLFNTAIITEYLDDRYRQTKLYADAPVERAEQRQYIWRFEQDWFRLADAPVERAEQRQYIWRFEQDWFRLADIMLVHDYQKQAH